MANPIDRAFAILLKEEYRADYGTGEYMSDGQVWEKVPMNMKSMLKDIVGAADKRIWELMETIHKLEMDKKRLQNTVNVYKNQLSELGADVSTPPSMPPPTWSFSPDESFPTGKIFANPKSEAPKIEGYEPSKWAKEGQFSPKPENQWEFSNRGMHDGREAIYL